MNTELIIKSTALALLCTSYNAVAKRNPLPNIVIIFIDDEGYGDVGCFGATGFKTPNLDRMASQGMKFTNYYSGSPVCSPSRAALLTGCYPFKVGINKVLFPSDTIGINPEDATIPEILRQKNYATAAIGKWHLGCQPKFMPLQHGFDEFFGLPYSNDMWPVNYDGSPVTPGNCTIPWKLNCPPLPLYDGNEKIEEISTLSKMNQLTTRYTEHAVDFIKKNQKKPFFLYLPHTMAHVPLGVSDKFKGKSEQGMYGDVMMEIDWSVGEIIHTLKECGIEKNTLLIFTTDNGPWMVFGNHAGSAGGLREAKGTTFEGGFRVPCIMKWPEIIPPGTVCNNMAGSIDILPTIADITGTDLPEKKIDGISVLDLLKGDFDKNPRREYLFYSGATLSAVRVDNWKLVFPHSLNSNVGSVPGKDGWPGKLNMVKFEGGLYDMFRDPGEQYDLKELHPEIVKKLEVRADEARKDLKDRKLKITRGGARPAGNIISK